MVEKIAVFSILIVFIGLFAWKRLWWWVGLWIGVGAVEGLSLLYTDRTLSQKFWAEALQDPTWAYITAAFVGVLGLTLAIHLVWKNIRGK